MIIVNFAIGDYFFGASPLREIQFAALDELKSMLCMVRKCRFSERNLGLKLKRV